MVARRPARSTPAPLSSTTSSPSPRPRRARLRRHGPAALAAGVFGLALVAGTASSAVADTGSPTPLESSGACEVSWGSSPKVVDVEEQSVTALVNVRAGQHRCYDRLVVDLFSQPPGGYAVSYVDPSSDQDRDVRGGAALRVQVDGGVISEMEDITGYAPSVTGFRTFREVTPFTTSEDLETTWQSTSRATLGVRARLPFRAFLLPVPSGERARLVVDVAH